MARDFGLVSVTLWNSRKFTALPSDDAKLLYLYLLTCPTSNSIGCFVIKPGYAAADLGWDEIRYRYGIDTLCKASLIGIDETENVIRIVDYLANCPIMNVKHGAGALRHAAALPDCEQKRLVFMDLAEQKHIRTADVEAQISALSDTVSIPFQNSIDIPVPVPVPVPVPREDLGKPKSRAPDHSEVCIAHFNATAERVGWARVQKITAPRRAALAQRIADVGGPEAWCEAIDRAARSPLLTGQTGRGWRADFDWLCKAANFTKLMEGNYDPRTNGGSDHARPDPRQTARDEEARRVANIIHAAARM